MLLPAFIGQSTVAAKRSGSLGDKMRALADHAKQLPADLKSQVDVVSARLTKIGQRGTAALGGMHAALDEVDAGVAATEDAINQLTNGGPEL